VEPTPIGGGYQHLEYLCYGSSRNVLQYDSASFTVTFTPSAPLAFNTSYALTVTTGVRNLAGKLTIRELASLSAGATLASTYKILPFNFHTGNPLSGNF